MKQLLIGWLAANNVVLANDSTDQIVWDKFLAEMSTRASNITTLANAKTELTGNITTLTAARDAEKKRADDAVTALGNAQSAEKAATLKFIEARVDLGITQGKIAVADRATEITALTNSKTLDADLEKLDKRPVKHAVASQLATDRKVDADSVQSARAQVLHLANSDPRYKDIRDYSAAFNAVLKDHPALAEQLRAKTETTATPATT